MNKTISINLSGLLFNLEEGAYNKLSNYLQQLRRSFENTEGCDEIMADIEGRIAELFTEKLKNKQVILEREVDEVIGVLGAPEDYETDQANEPGPSRHTAGYRSEESTRRLYRDPENAVLGGVCSGISYYFAIDPLWLRLAFVVALFFAGTGPLLYIILWIVIPKANSTAEKLQMRGEEVNIENIERRIRDEADRIRMRAGQFGENAKREFQNANIGNRFGSFINEFVHAVIRFVNSLVKIMGRSLGLFFLLIGGVLLFFYLSSILSSGTFFSFDDIEGISSFSLNGFLSVFFVSAMQQDLFVLGIALVIAAPIIGLLLLGIRLVGYPRIKLGWAVPVNGFVFLAGLILCIVTCALLITDFTAKARRIDPFALTPLNTDTLQLSIQPNSELNIKQAAQIDHWKFYFNDGDNHVTGLARLNIAKAENNQFALHVQRSARGEDKKQALSIAEGVRYFIRQDGESVYLNPYFSLPKDDKWRSQKVEFTVLIPEGKHIRFSPGMEDMLNDIPNVQHIDDDEMVGKTWMMTDDGLTCTSCPSEEE